MMKVLRVVVLGAKRVGKTSLLNKYLHSFLDHVTEPSSSQDVHNTTVDHVIEPNSSQDVHNTTVLFPDGQYHRVEFVDMNDLHEYPAMKEVYIQTGDAFVVVYAIDNRQSYEIAQTICQEITQHKDENLMTIVQRKRKNVRISEEEVLMMLRSYQVHPCSWHKIIQSIQDNSHQLSKDTQKLYTESGRKQLKNRLSNKFAKLMVAPEGDIKNKLIREEIRKIKEKEQSLIKPTVPSKKDKREDLFRDRSESSDDDEPGPRPSTSTPRRVSVYTNATARPGPSTSTPRRVPASTNATANEGATTTGNKERKGKKRPLMDLIRSNQEAYNEFITKKVPKLLRVLGVSDSE